MNKKKPQTERGTCERHGWFPITENGKVQFQLPLNRDPCGYKNLQDK